MTRDEIMSRLAENYGHIYTNPEEMSPNFRAIANVLGEEVPEYRFALRDDLKDDKRFLPTRATSQSAGWDVSFAPEDHKPLTIQPGEYVKLPLGIRCIPEKGWWLECKPRSSTFIKKKMHALYGTIDFDYRFQCFFCAEYRGDQPLILEFGEKIAQFIPVKTKEMKTNEISNEEFDLFCAEEENDRKGGFGSTSK